MEKLDEVDQLKIRLAREANARILAQLEFLKLQQEIINADVARHQKEMTEKYKLSPRDTFGDDFVIRRAPVSKVG